MTATAPSINGSTPALRATIEELLARAQYTTTDGYLGESLNPARAATFTAITAYWNGLSSTQNLNLEWPLRNLTAKLGLSSISNEVKEMATSIGEAVTSLEVPESSYWIGSIYTGMMPERKRAVLGAYYTPPSLCERLLDMATNAHFDWRNGRVLDPACGGGAFLSPVAKRMLESLYDLDPQSALTSIEKRLRGIELDPFAAWMSQIFLDATLFDVCSAAGRLPKPVIHQGDALKAKPTGRGFDLVVGNPPYGRVTLSPELRQKFKRSLFGHANLYGVFTDLALRLVKPRGVIGYVTPTSFLAGAYFKELRGLMGTQAPPVSIDFITQRKGIFTDVMQETALTVYQQGESPSVGEVRFTTLQLNGSTTTEQAGNFQIPKDPSVV